MLDPRGMGVQAILTSDLFRLRSTLDIETQRVLDRQRQLSGKKGELSPEEEVELRTINTKLYHLGLSKSIRDPLYELFITKWTEREKPEWAEAVELTPKQLKDREALAAEIASEIAGEMASERGPAK